MKSTPIKKPTPTTTSAPTLNQIINMFWDNHNKNESIIRELIQYQATNTMNSTFNLRTIKTEPKKDYEERKSKGGDRIMKSIKIEPISFGLTELPKDDIDTKENNTYQAMTSNFDQHHYDEEEKQNNQGNCKEDNEKDKGNVNDYNKPVTHYLTRLPNHINLTEKRLAYIFDKIKEKWPICDYDYTNEIAFKVFELKDYNSAASYRFVSTKQFPKYLADNYNKTP